MTTIILITFIAYLSFITIKFGWLPSISESWYRLSFKQKPLFWLFCFIIGLNLILMDKLLFQIAGIGLWLTGTMAPFKLKWMWIEEMHCIGAYTCIIVSLLGILVYYHSPASIIGFASAYFFLVRVKNATFWVEVNGFFWSIIGLYLFSN